MYVFIYFMYVHNSLLMTLTVEVLFDVLQSRWIEFPLRILINSSECYNVFAVSFFRFVWLAVVPSPSHATPSPSCVAVYNPTGISSINFLLHCLSLYHNSSGIPVRHASSQYHRRMRTFYVNWNWYLFYYERKLIYHLHKSQSILAHRIRSLIHILRLYFSRLLLLPYCSYFGKWKFMAIMVLSPLFSRLTRTLSMCHLVTTSKPR